MPITPIKYSVNTEPAPKNVWSIKTLEHDELLGLENPVEGKTTLPTVLIYIMLGNDEGKTIEAELLIYTHISYGNLENGIIEISKANMALKLEEPSTRLYTYHLILDANISIYDTDGTEYSTTEFSELASSTNHDEIVDARTIMVNTLTGADQAAIWSLIVDNIPQEYLQSHMGEPPIFEPETIGE